MLDPCPQKLINRESINADLDLIYHEIYWECVFSFRTIVSKKRVLSQKSATSKKKFEGKHNFGFWVAYSNKLQIEFNTAIY